MAEERMTDDPLKKGLEDEFVDIELDGMPEEGAADENYDESLVGLTPTQLKEELDKRREQEEKAQREKKRLLSAAAEKREMGKFEEAATFYEQAMLYGEDCSFDVWACRTQEFTSIDCFEKEEISTEFRTYASDKTVQTVLKRVGASLEARIAEYETEATPLREKWEAGRDSRREAFRNNRNYYLLRFGISFVAFVLLGIACWVAGGYIVRTKDYVAPILTGVFGLLALVALGFTFFFSRGLFLGQKLVRDNEKRSATEDGVRLTHLENLIHALKVALEGGNEKALEEADETLSEAPMSEE